MYPTTQVQKQKELQREIENAVESFNTSFLKTNKIGKLL